MEELRFRIPKEEKQTMLLDMGGRDRAGNLYQADSRSLLVNGKRVLPVMGELQYSRMEPEGWREALLKMRAGGVNIVATYVFWNYHEEKQGEWDFTGCRNLRGFLELCRDMDIKVWLRIGPWAHGECRHGGFPDYVQYAQDFEKRTDDPKYLELVRILYGKIGWQAAGMMCKDGGPVIGIQLENEYGHCGGPSDRAEQAEHLRTLLRLAREAGLETPYYTATAWGGACTIDETLQVLSGYVDAPWDDSLEALPAMENYLFMPWRDDANTGSDFHRPGETEGTIRTDYPYLTAELGGGLQVTSHRRPVADAADHAGHIVSVLGSGANLVGYYMYHGGIQPEGKYSDLNEAQSIGGHTTVPRRSYDFDACINEAGKLQESFGVLKKYHLLLESFGEELAETQMILPEILPESAEDMKTLRAALRWNYSTGSGFLFVNNHVRNRSMEAHEDVTLRVLLPDGGEILWEHLRFEADGCYVIPLGLRVGETRIRETDASLLCRLGKRIFLYTDGEARLETEGNGENVTVLSEGEANRSFLLPDGLYVTERQDSCVLLDGEKRKLLTGDRERIRVYREDGGIEEYMAGPSQEELAAARGLWAGYSLLEEERDKHGAIRCRIYQIDMAGLERVKVNQIYLQVDYLGDRAEVWADGKLIDDWFTTGKPWRIALRRFGYPSGLQIRIYDSAHTIPCCFGQGVYYDLPVKPGCEIRNVRLSAEYLVSLEGKPESGFTRPLEGIWRTDIGDGTVHRACLPGTLDENRIGHPDSGSNQWHPAQESDIDGWDLGKENEILTRFTRKATCEGEARLTRRISLKLPPGKRLFLEAERARCLRLLADGREVPHFRQPSVSTPQVFELTKDWQGESELTLLSDNSYPGLPRDAIVFSSAATDETQTNWNGVLGYFRLRVEEQVFLEDIRVYPMGNTLTVQVQICAGMPWKGALSLHSSALAGPVRREITLEKGSSQIVFQGLPLAPDTLRWDEGEGNLHELTACLEEAGKDSAVPGDACGSQNGRTVTFGVRDFGVNADGRLALNGRTIFLRSEANCAVFPETGHCPMSVEEWLEILTIYQSYGINCMRFHSHCPPEAAFTAADRLGMLMQPELSHWNPRDAFETEESFACYRAELLEILRMLANHPSFVMLTFGNELHATPLGHERMTRLLEEARSLDPTRLYANGSNVHYGMAGCDENSDFYTSSNYYEWDLRGTFANMKGYLNHDVPDAAHQYDRTMEKLRESYGGPVFSFEVGQFEVLPDFEELEDFQGISEPANLRRIRRRVEERGLLPVWKKYVEASGELSRIGYREEIEAAMRTEGLSGISLLGLQDFPGQGTALVGMLNSHLQPKPYPFADPKAFRRFFTDQLPLVLLPGYTWENTQVLEAKVRMANFGKKAVEGPVRYRLSGGDFCLEGGLGEALCPAGKLTDVGELRLPLQGVRMPARLELRVRVGNAENSYPIWVYPPTHPVCPEDVYETTCLDEGARQALEAGKRVYLSPPSTKEALPASIQAQFTTDFWSVGTFPDQEGAMGQLIDTKHPVFRDFPTEFHTNWQWWPMATQRALLLPGPLQAIITEMDSYASLRPMAQLLECRCLKGRLLISSMGLQDLQEHPSARALLSSIYRYLASDEFRPVQEIAWETLRPLAPGPEA